MNPCSIRALQGPGSSLCVTPGAGAGTLLQVKADPNPAGSARETWNGIPSQELSSIPEPSALSSAGDTVASPAWVGEGPCGTWFILHDISGETTLVKWDKPVKIQPWRLPWPPPAWGAPQGTIFSFFIRLYFKDENCSAFTPQHRGHPRVGASSAHPSAISHKRLCPPP